MQCERVCPRRTFAASRGGCKPGTVRRVLSLSSRRGERGFSPASRTRGCRRYQGRRACRPAAKRPDRATWVVPRLELFRPSHDKLMGRPFLFCPNVKITPRTFTRRFTLCRRNSPNSMPRRAPRIASIRTGATRGISIPRSTAAKSRLPSSCRRRTSPASCTWATPWMRPGRTS